MSLGQIVKVFDESHVAPPPGSVSTTTVPLTFFDRAWLFCCPMQRLFFYEIPQPTLHFTETVIPHLKQSLSLTLQHFFPLAANLICPSPPNEPYIHYSEGDFIVVTVAVAESDADFNHLVANHARDAQQFHSLVPKLPFASVSSDKTNVFPVMAMQVTIFPNSGVSIGVTFIHVASDGRSFNHFMKSWASIHKSGAAGLTSLSLPYHSTDVIKKPDGVSSIFLKNWCWENLGSVAAVPDGLVRVTLVISGVQIEKLKLLVRSTLSRNDNKTEILHVSTYAVACGFMWVNLIKLQESDNISGQLHDDLLYHFISVADCRDRLEFRIPATYFGNCLAYFIVPAKRRELMAEDGIVFAATAIGRTIRRLEKGPLIGAEKWVSDFKEILKDGRTVSVAGSPRLRVYDTDFGWGRPKKSEVVHIGAYGSFSLAEPRDEGGGVEIGLVLGQDKLDVFNVIFEQFWLNLK